MATNGQILARALRGEQLLESEIMQLERAVGDYDVASRATYELKNGAGELNIMKINSRFGHFEKFPSFVYRAERVGSQSINDNTETGISLNARDPGTDEFSSVGNNIYVLHPQRVIGILGKVQWQTNGTGRRGAHVRWFNNAGTLLTGTTMHSLKPEGTASDTMPFVTILDFADYPTGAYLDFTVIQTSGGALNVEGFKAGVFVLE